MRPRSRISPSLQLLRRQPLGVVDVGVASPRPAPSTLGEASTVTVERQPGGRLPAWAPGSVRSCWFHEVEAVLDAIDRGAPDAELEQLATAATDRARELTERVIRERVIPNAEQTLRDALAEVGVEDTDELAIAELVALCRQDNVTVDQTHVADGVVVNEREATAFAVMRSLVDPDVGESEWVRVQLVEVST